MARPATNEDIGQLRPNLGKLSSINEEILRRQLSKKIQFYCPHPKQKLFHQSPAYCRIILGGNRAGKTKALVAECLSYCLGERKWDLTKTRRPPCKVLLAGQIYTKDIRNTIIPAIEEMLPDGALLPDGGRELVHNGIIGTYNFANGSMLAIYSYEVDKNSVEGSDWDFVGFNEPPPEWFFTGCIRGLIDRGGRMAFAMTPISQPWIYDRVYSQCGKNKDYWSIIIDQDDNPYLGEEEKKRFRETLSKEEYEARIHGKFKFLMGRVYKNYAPETHFFDAHAFFAKLQESYQKDPCAANDFASWPKGCAMDPHPKKPCAILWWAISPKNQMILFDEWPSASYYHVREQVTLEQVAETIIEKERNMPGGSASIVWRAMDPNYGRTRNIVTGKSTEDEFRQYGLLFDTRVSDAVDPAVMSIRQRMEPDMSGEPGLIVLSTCQNTHDSLMKVTYEEDSEKIKPEFGDFHDALRYADRMDPRWFNRANDIMGRKNTVERLKRARSF